ncbi:hypothetical protein MKX03_008264, partial [Papaver bracteatum]
MDTFLLKVYSNGSTGGIKHLIIRKALMVKNMIHLHRFRNEILTIQARLKAVSDSKVTFGIKDLRDNIEASSSEPDQKKIQHPVRYHYSHVMDNDDFIGFKEYTETILTELMKDDERRCVISIVGVGGLGKTTLAKEIYKHGIVRSSFDCWGWSSISQRRRLNLKDVLGEIMNCMSLPNNELQMNAADLKEKLYNYLQNKRYFVVLDNIWSIQEWDVLSPCFPVGKRGSKVLLTTRNRDVALQEDPLSLHFEPPFLNDDDSWELLRKKAFPRNTTDVNGYPADLEKLGREMVQETLVSSMEDIGKQQYLAELSQRCMIQIDKEFIPGKGKIGSVCPLHDLVRDLCSVKATEFPSICNSLNPSTRDILKEAPLRRFFGIQGRKSKQTAKVLSNKHLRVLELANCTVRMLPGLSKLIHL